MKDAVELIGLVSMLALVMLIFANTGLFNKLAQHESLAQNANEAIERTAEASGYSENLIADLDDEHSFVGTFDSIAAALS